MYDPGLHLIYGGLENGFRETGSEIDIVAVHGLNFKNNENHARATWSSQGSIWIRDFLPSRLQRPCRVMLFAYNSSPAMGAAAMRLDEHAKKLLQCLMAKRKETPQRPIVFLCHSLGGIVVKSALVEATLDPAYKSIVKSTRLLVFFATPHLGGNYSGIGDVAARIVRTASGIPSNDLLDGLKAGSRDVIRRFEQARHLPEACLVISFYETENYGRLGLIVEKNSAVLDLPADKEKQVALKANHSRVCKFPTADSCEPVMELIVTELNRALELQQVLEPGPENVHWMVPRSANPLFTGRDDIVRRIIDSIMSDEDRSPIHQKRYILTGIGGQGKSEVCLNVVHQVRAQFWGVFWVDVGSKSTATRDFTRIARLFGSEAREIDDILLILANCSEERNWLLVLDNADDMDTDYQEYLPSGTRGVVLLTSRLRECRLLSTTGYEELGSLRKEDCVSLLLKVVGVPEESSAEYIPAAEAIAMEMGFHTLALLQAGAYIAAGNCSMAEYPEEYRQQRDQLLRLGLSQSQSRYRNVYATFEVTAHALESSETESARDALHLLELLSTFHYDDIPMDFFEDAWYGAKKAESNPEDDGTIDHLSRWHVSQLPGFLAVHETAWNPDRLSSALANLHSLALIKATVSRDGKMVSLHPLIHSWVAARQDEPQRRLCVQSSASIIALSQYSNPKWRSHRDRLGPHITSLITAPYLTIDRKTSGHTMQALLQICKLMEALRCDQELSLLLDQTLQHYNASVEHPTEDLLPIYSLLSSNQFSMKKVPQCIKTIKNVQAIQRRKLHEHHPDRIATEQELARAYHTNGQWKDAMAILEKVHGTHEQHFNLRRDHPDRLALLHQLGSVYHTTGRINEAISLLEEVVSIQEVTLDELHPCQISSKHQLASAYIANCQTQEAVKLLEELDAVQDPHLHRQHPNRLGLQMGLGRAYLESGDEEKAIEVLEKVSEIQNTLLDESHPDRLATEHLLGSAYRTNGRTQEAIAMFEKMLKLPTYGASHPNRVATEYELGAAYLARGRTKDAIELFERLEVVQGNDIDSNHPRRLMMQVELSSAYLSNGQVGKAIRLLEKVIQVQKLTLDDDHPNLLASQHRLGTAYLDNGQTKDAIAIFEKMVRTTSNEMRGNHLASQHELGRAYIDNGQIKEAVQIFEHVVKCKESMFHETHPDRLVSLHELGRVYLMDGQIKRAIEICEEVIRVQESVLDENHPDQLKTKRLLGSAYLNDNQTTRALELLQKTDALERTRLDEAHPDRLASKHQLGTAYVKAGRIKKAIILFKESLMVAQKNLREDHPMRLALQHQLGSAYLANGQTAEAIQLLQETVRVQKSSDLPENHTTRLASLHTLGSAYMKHGRAREAMVILEEVVRLQAHLDKGNLRQLASQHELGCCYLRVGQIEDAIKVFEDMAQIEGVFLQTDDPSRVESQGQLGIAYLRTGRVKDAIKTLEAVVSVGKTSLDRTNISRLASELMLGLAYIENHQDNKGIAMLEEVLEVEKTCLEVNHSLRLQTQFELARACMDVGKMAMAITLLEELMEIKNSYRTGYRDEGYPSRKEVRIKLARAYKEKNFFYRILTTFGMGSCIGPPDVLDEENYEL